MCSHVHDYHQILLTLNGYVELKIGDYDGRVNTGEAILIKAGQRHSFRAFEAARFIVADITELPDNLVTMNKCKFPINAPLLSFIQFVDKQLQFQVNSALEKQLNEIFTGLLRQLPMVYKVDRRIERAITAIHSDLSVTHSIPQLSKVSYLGHTQFKKLFKACLGVSVGQYRTEVRMEKARSLLSHTDLPVSQVAQEVGYEDLSSFSRRFSLYYGQSPSQFSISISR
mgnify:CR=1 FL=1